MLLRSVPAAGGGKRNKAMAFANSCRRQFAAAL
jgi:hypothetical protein